MKGPFRNKQGSSLLEIVVAIAVLGLMVAPVCSSLVLSHRLNADSEELLQARLLVESTVEQLMAEGLVYELNDEGQYVIANECLESLKNVVEVSPSIFSADDNKSPDKMHWYTVTVKADEVEVSTAIRIAYAEPVTPEEGGDGS